MGRRINSLFAALLLLLGGAGFGLQAASAAEADANAYILLNVESDGILSARDLVFTNRDSGEEIWFRDLLSLGRAGSQSYLMEPLPAGEYYLSRIYPNVNVNDAAPSIEAGEEDGVIIILADTINYIGDFLFKSRERGRGIASSFDYEPNSNTLISAVTAQRELFESLDVAISIAGNQPVPVDKKLLGL